jgi:hypothetical protein
MTEKSQSEKPSVTLPGTVEQIIPSSYPGMPEKAQIAIERAEDLYQQIRIDNTLTDKHGNKVGLKKGADVEVTVEAEPGATTPKPTKTKN